VSIQPAVCSTCGAKHSAELRRCPRCRAVVVRPDPAAPAISRRGLAILAAGVVVVIALGGGALWVMRDVTPAARSGAGNTPVDLPAAQHAAAQPAKAVRMAAATADRPFLDPSAGAAIAYSSGDMAAALRQYQTAADRNPNDAESLSNLGQVLVRLGRPAEALRYFERAIALIPDRWAYRFNLARALGILERWKESVEVYRQAQTLFPADYATAFNFALALRKAGDDKGAVVQFEKAIALEPTDASFRMALGVTYERLERPVEAAAAYEEALRLAPQAPDAEAVRSRIAKLRGSSGGN
jgi:Flp pilus assembly protein TadD